MKKRLAKYERILQFQVQQMDLIKQQIGTQKSRIESLEVNQRQLQSNMVDVESQFRTSSDSALLNVHGDQVMILLQRQINQLRGEIFSANEKLDHLLHTLREKNKHKRSWEKLVENTADDLDAAQATTEAKIADDRYLATKFGVAK